MLCECGCGQVTAIAKQTNAKYGQVKGKPMRFVQGHHLRSRHPEFVVEDRGYKTPCHIWQRAVTNKGYGHAVVNGKHRLAHVVAYERVHGPVPPGFELDHLCRVRLCVNAEHLEAVTHLVNVRRGSKAMQTHCARGHLFDETNTYRDLTTGTRKCRACRRIRARERYHRRKATLMR